MLDISKTLIYEFWYDYIKPKSGEKSKLCYMDTDSFIIHAKSDMIYIKILQKMCVIDLIHQVMKQIDCCLWEKIKRLLAL